MKYNNTIKLNDLFIDNYINNEIEQFNGQGTYGACDLLLSDISENIILCVLHNYVTPIIYKQ